MTTTVVSNNQKSTNQTFNKGDTLIVASGGSAHADTFNSGASGIINDNQYGIHNSLINSGAVLIINKNGFGTVNTNSGTVIVSSGGEYNYNYTNAGGTTIVSSGGLAWTNFVSGVGATVLISSGGFGSDARVLNGGSYDVLRGGVVSGASVSSGGNLTVSSAGSAATVNILSGGTVNVGQAAFLNSGTVASGAVIDVNGGSATNLKIDGGSAVLHNLSATSNTSFTSNGGTLIASSGYSNGTQGWTLGDQVIMKVSSGATVNSSTVTSGGAVVVYSGGALNGASISSGGLLAIADAAISGNIIVASGATAVVSALAGPGTITLAGDGSKLSISGTQMPTNTISGFTTNDQIDLTSVPKARISNVARTNNQVVITMRDGTKYTLNAPGADNYGYQLLDDGRGGTIYTTCFAAGTLIATPNGAMPVEALTEGTLVTTPKGDMPVKWLGHRAITVADQRVPEENWLIRIKADALADGIPSRDLLITQEHCMVFEGKLVPARMLVNATSIIVDRTIPAYTYYHVELDTHEALWAEGALTESYLDTGNRDQFENNPVTALFAKRVAGGSETLPLDTTRNFVEPIYAAIAARAGIGTIQATTTTETDLHLTTNRGQIIHPARQTDGRAVFMIPADVTEVRLVSRASRPSDTIGPFVDDRRLLGVLVGEISLFRSNVTTLLTSHLSDASLPGWHGLEDGAYRWTAGDAVLPLDAAASSKNEQGILAVQIVTAGPYLVDNAQHRRAS